MPPLPRSGRPSVAACVPERRDVVRGAERGEWWQVERDLGAAGSGPSCSRLSYMLPPALAGVSVEAAVRSSDFPVKQTAVWFTVPVLNHPPSSDAVHRPGNEFVVPVGGTEAGTLAVGSDAFHNYAYLYRFIVILMSRHLVPLIAILVRAEPSPAALREASVDIDHPTSVPRSCAA